MEFHGSDKRKYLCVVLDTAIVSLLHVQKVEKIIVTNGSAMLQDATTVGILTLFVLLQKYKCRRYEFRITSSKRSRNLAFFFFECPDDTISSVFSKTVDAVNKTLLIKPKKHKCVTVKGIRINVSCLLSCKITQMFTTKQVFLSLCNLPLTDYTMVERSSNILSMLTSLWGITFDIPSLIRRGSARQKCDCLFSLFWEMQKTPGDCDIDKPYSCAYVYCILDTLHANFWQFASMTVSSSSECRNTQLASMEYGSDNIRLQLLLTYWYHGVRCRSRSKSGLLTTNALNLLFDSNNKGASVLFDDSMFQGRPIEYTLFEVWGMINSFSDINASLVHPYAMDARLASLYALAPFLFWPTDISKIAEMVYSIEHYNFGEDVCQATLLYSYCLYLLLPNTAENTMYYNVLHELLWGSCVFSRDDISCNTNTNRLKEIILERLAAVSVYDKQTKRVCVPVSVFCNPTQSVVCEPLHLKKMLDFAHLFLKHLHTSDLFQSGFSVDFEWFVVPSSLFFHNESMPGGSSFFSFNDFPSDWMRKGEMTYLTHDTDERRCNADKKDTLHEDMKVDKKRCIFCTHSMNVVTQTYCIAFKTKVLTGDVIFHPRLASYGAFSTVASILFSEDKKAVSDRARIKCSCCLMNCSIYSS